MASSIVINGAPSNQRVMRSPRHSFLLKQAAFQIQPFLLAPVLPGETLENLVIQSRVVSDPINNPLIGWWCEYFIFYVKHRDMYERDLLSSMVLDPNANLAALDSATKVEHYHTNGTDLAINWVDMCLRRVVDEYFRNEGETTATASIGNLPAAGLSNKTFIDSAINNASIVGSSFDENLVSTSAGQGDATAGVFTSEIEAAMRRYEMAREMNLTDMTYEDFLATYGVRPAAVDLHVPELIRYVRDWTYPTNTIDPSNGTPRSAVSWAISERADKKRFFTEPGFIFGVSVIRPKVYLRTLTSNAAMLMRDAYRWLPAVMSDDPWTSMVKVTASDPPLDSNTDAYWVDVKDLLLYGDQFINYAPSATDSNAVALPAAGLTNAGKQYPSLTDAQNLFVTPATVYFIRQDGVVQLHIKGRQTDTSPQLRGTNKTV